MACPFAVSAQHSKPKLPLPPPHQRGGLIINKSSGLPAAPSASAEPASVYIPPPPLTSGDTSDINSRSTLPAGAQPSRLPPAHQLRPATLALHASLHAFASTTPHYATVPYTEAFNWSALGLSEDVQGEWYAVAFRSKRKPGTERDLALYKADKAAHEEALDNGGLLLYWYGRPDEDGANLATCIWESRAHARAANSRPHHLAAVRLTAASYAYYTLERYTLRKIRGETGIKVERWETGTAEEKEEVERKGAGVSRQAPTCERR